MVRSDEAQWFFDAVYEAVQQIPHGRVTSYGHIALLLGRRKWDTDVTIISVSTMARNLAQKANYAPNVVNSAERPRQVGVSLKQLPSFTDDGERFFHDRNVPWQRVINAKGIISPRGPGGASRQAAALRQEGVTVETGSLGELMVDLSSFGWFPTRLPGEEPETSSPHDSDRELDG